MDCTWTLSIEQEAAVGLLPLDSAVLPEGSRSNVCAFMFDFKYSKAICSRLQAIRSSGQETTQQIVMPRLGWRTPSLEPGL